MKEQMKTKKTWLVLLIMLLMACLTAGLNTKSVHASSSPTLTIDNHAVIFLEGRDEAIKLNNLPEDVESVDWRVDDPKIAKLSDTEDDYAYVEAKKPGTVNVTATITYYEDVIDQATGREIPTEKTYVATKAITIKHADGIKGIKIGNSKVKDVKRNPGIFFYNNQKGKLKISMNKGWKASSIVFKDGKTKKKVKNGSKINSKALSSYLYITVMDTKTKATYKVTVEIEKYDTWKITYGKMKKGTTLCLSYFYGGRGDARFLTYNKKAKISKDQFKNCEQLAKILKELDPSTTKRKNVITIKRPITKGKQEYNIKWKNPGKGCKAERIKTAR